MDRYTYDDSSVAFQVAPYEFLKAPGYVEARNRLIAGKLAVYEGSHLFNRLILEEGRFLCYLAALSLHAGQDMAQPSTWLTLGRLQREVTELGVASRNRVEAQVSTLRKYGFLTQQPHASDRRVRLLVPSNVLLARDAAILGHTLTALSEIGLSPINGWQGVPNAEMHRGLRRALLPHLQGFSRVMRRHLPLASFFAHDCGYMILLLLLRGAIESGDGQIISTCYQRLATQTGVSRTHVRRIVEAARDTDLLSTTARGGHDIRLNQTMWNAADRWFGDKLALTDLLLRESTARTQPSTAAA